MADGPQNERIRDLIATLQKQELSQTEIATRAGLPPQVLSDLKNGHRGLTELTARRLGDTFGVNFEWLLGKSVSREPEMLSSASIRTSEGTLWLPQFDHPIAGEPRQHHKYDGREVEVTGAAATRAMMAQDPYVLRFGAKDVRHRLQTGDFLLVSQAENSAAELCVVMVRKKFYLARRGPKGFERVVTGKAESTAVERGHCLGIVWAALY